jgi:hypothetical protein
MFTPRPVFPILLRRHRSTGHARIDALACPKGGGRLKMSALSLEKDVVRRVLLSLGLPCEAPIIARARAPTLPAPRGVHHVCWS